MRHFSLALCLLAIVMFLSPVAYAVRIAGVTATTTMGSGFGTNLINTVNGVGLSAPTLTATHDGTTPVNSWVSGTGVLSGQVTFNLGASFPVDGFSFWNQNGGGPGANGSTGIRQVSVLSSTDGVAFNPVPGAPITFAQVPGAAALPPEVFTFPAVTATHIRFQIANNYGGTAQTGFGEVGFNAVPEPTTSSLLLLTFVVGAASRRVRVASR